MKVGLFAKIKVFVKKLASPIIKPIQWLIKLFSPKKPALQTAPPQEPQTNKIPNILSVAVKVSKNPLANITSFLATKALPWVKKGIRSLFEKPAASIIAGAGIFASSSLLPASSPFVLILRGTGIATSGIGFLRSFPKQINKAFNSYKIAGSVGRAANTFSTFLTGLTTASASASLPAWIFILPIALLAGLTLFTVFTSSAAFLPEGVGETPVHIGTHFEPRSNAAELAEKVIYTLNHCAIQNIEYVNKNTLPSTKLCLETSNLPNYELIIEQFDYSVQVGPGLQCVGFVRGIMAALGKPLEGNRNAKDYLNAPTPSGYAPVNSDMTQVKIGDLVITQGKIYGHIAIVVDKIGDEVIVAQAWGDDNGKLELTSINPIYFDGFLRPL